MKIKLIQKLLLALSAAAFITGTSARATPLAIGNFSFEANASDLWNTWSGGKYGNPGMTIDSWTTATTGTSANGPYISQVVGYPPDGNQNISATMWYGTSVATTTYSGAAIGAFELDTTYTLTVAINLSNVSGKFTLNLLDNGTPIASHSVSLSSPSGWQDLTVTAHSGYTVGDQIGISVVFDNTGASASGSQFNLDNVRLSTGPYVVPPLTVTAQPNTKDYDGTTAAAAIPTITAGSLQNGDVATLTEAYDTSLIGTAKTLIPSVVIRNAGVDVTANYYVTKVNDNTGVILTDLTGGNLIHNWSFEANSNNLIFGDTGNTGNGQTWSPPSSFEWPIGYWMSSGNTYAYGLVGLASGLLSPAAGKQCAVASLFGAGEYQYLTYTGGNLGNFAVDTTYTLKLAVNLVQGADSGAEFNIYLLDLTTGPDGSVVVGTSQVKPTVAGWQDLTLSVNSGYVVGHQIGVKLSIYTPAIGAAGVVQGEMDNMRLAAEGIALTPYQLWAASFSGFTDTDPTHDPDGDGMTNQQEFAFGLDPTKGSSSNPITAQLDKASGAFRYTRLKQTTSGLSFKVYTSPDLIRWTEDGAATQRITATDYDVETVEVTLSAGKPLTESKLFVRVAAE